MSMILVPMPVDSSGSFAPPKVNDGAASELGAAGLVSVAAVSADFSKRSSAACGFASAGTSLTGECVSTTGAGASRAGAGALAAPPVNIPTGPSGAAANIFAGAGAGAGMFSGTLATTVSLGLSATGGGSGTDGAGGATGLLAGIALCGAGVVLATAVRA